MYDRSIARSYSASEWSTLYKMQIPCQQCELLQVIRLSISDWDGQSGGALHMAHTHADWAALQS